MRAVAYSIRSFEKEPLAKANHKKHDITLISNPIGLETAEYASGKEVVIVSGTDSLTEPILAKLSKLGVKYIAIRAKQNYNIDKAAIERLKMAIATVDTDYTSPATGPEFIEQHHEIASSTIKNLDRWCLQKKEASRLGDGSF